MTHDFSARNIPGNVYNITTTVYQKNMILGSVARASLCVNGVGPVHAVHATDDVLLWFGLVCRTIVVLGGNTTDGVSRGRIVGNLPD